MDAEKARRRKGGTPKKRELSVPHVSFAAHGDEEKGSWGFDALRIREAWKECTGKGVKVAVLDSGVDLRHPDLAEAVAIAVDCANNGAAGVVDMLGHGTHCAGTIGARANGLGALGVAPGCALLVAKVVNDEYGSHPDYLAAGISWAVAQDAHIISMSMGFRTSTVKLQEAVQQAHAKGIVLIAAGGNNEHGAARTELEYPAKYPECLAVGAVDRANSSAGISIVAPDLAVVAPGVGMFSTDIASKGFYSDDRSGSSMAAAFVSGVVALWMEKAIARGHDRSPAHVRELLIASADALDGGNSSGEFSCGLVNPLQFLARISS